MTGGEAFPAPPVVLADASSDLNLILCAESKWWGDRFACRWCNGPILGRRTRWCSDECANQFGRQHWWTAARNAAAKRDGYKCVRCNRGVRNALGELELDRLGRWLSTQVHHKTPLHTLLFRTYGGVIRKVRHGDSGCHHHVSGLETLCTDCHHDEHHPAADDGQLELEVV